MCKPGYTVNMKNQFYNEAIILTRNARIIKPRTNEQAKMWSHVKQFKHKHNQPPI